ncbi:hypothetical protein OY671_010254, partial [Metschnikowia pulcherrima]
MVIISAALAP